MKRALGRLFADAPLGLRRAAEALSGIALSLVLATAAGAQGVPDMTIQIFNPASNNYNIYPVISAGAASTADEWLQAYFKITLAQLNTGKFFYPRTGIPRIYVNCCTAGENGIPPGGSVTLTLPLFSPLNNATVDPNNPTPPGSFADWWQGGHVEMFANKIATKAPPPPIVALYRAETAGSLPIFKGTAPTCTGAPLNKNACKLHFFFDTTSIGNNVTQQLLEYTLGADPINPKNGEKGQPNRLFVPNNVDYDVSYVNNALYPAVMEPFGNPLIGWVGVNSTIDDFTKAIDGFRKSTIGSGWPFYKGTSKVASALEFFLDYTPDHYDPNLTQSQPVIRMINLVDACDKGGTAAICGRIRNVLGLLRANFANYKKFYKANGPNGDWGCDQSFTPPDTLTDKSLRGHLWGWGPFVEHCSAGANQLYDTPGYTRQNKQHPYQQVKKEFDQLQYWDNFPVTDKYGEFDPYVALIHGQTFINAPYVYAYSVDDAFGNMQADGTGLIIEVGGIDQLPNPDHATPNANVGYGRSTKNLNTGVTITFLKYGVCTTDPAKFLKVPDFTSFPVPLGINNQTVTNCPMVWVDNFKRTYRFSIKSGPPWPEENKLNPAKNHDPFIDCSKNPAKLNTGWCNQIFVYQQIDPNDPADRLVYSVQVPAPPDFPP